MRPIVFRRSSFFFHVQPARPSKVSPIAPRFSHEPDDGGEVIWR